MAKAEKRVKITLECTECKRRNYITMKSKINDRERLEMKKYCSHEEQNSMIRRYIAWRNRHTDNEELHAISIRANVA